MFTVIFFSGVSDETSIHINSIIGADSNQSLKQIGNGVLYSFRDKDMVLEKLKGLKKDEAYKVWIYNMVLACLIIKE